ncbi:hypothetical protein VitviT2T_011040 [Vitis vinifera]|uniref:Protein DCL, chloroplastic n=2 Tax=Vitis vinifera TaxID=29760 RepID=A5BA53_VITVI|nr:protein DCL homolog, chloroplastic [Vitis vinifera]RVX21498.1 Protein DCL, chloroplastic [Vitis vinifera]WJZ92010.1 hypothetical protein VitviT2T_011040 [Vitis vinifera]CAN69898.1 hypothetical protein VITISV_032063 [Vitis vinifera]|eukprot:XP_002282478.1 PREDICTED: protein DCL, chloroplastic [Vitis vinifera]
MASVARSSPPLQIHHLHTNPISLHPSHPILHFATHRTPSVPALKTASDGSQEVYGPDLLRKPHVSAPDDEGDRKRTKRKGGEWVDWEDQILEDTVPLVGFVRMILHSGKYRSGERLSPEHEKIILERLLPYHPGYERKIGSGIDYITVGYHPEFESSRCLFIVRKDGELVDFSYWKCIKGFIRKNYPLYADSFILRHFRQHRRSE